MPRPKKIKVVTFNVGNADEELIGEVAADSDFAGLQEMGDQDRRVVIRVSGKPAICANRIPGGPSTPLLFEESHQIVKSLAFPLAHSQYLSERGNGPSRMKQKNAVGGVFRLHGQHRATILSAHWIFSQFLDEHHDIAKDMSHELASKTRWRRRVIILCDSNNADWESDVFAPLRRAGFKSSPAIPTRGKRPIDRIIYKGFDLEECWAGDGGDSDHRPLFGVLRPKRLLRRKARR